MVQPAFGASLSTDVADVAGDRIAETSRTSGGSSAPWDSAVVLPRHVADVSFGMRAKPVLGAAFLVGVVMATSGCAWGGGLPGANSPLPTASATLHWAAIDLPRGSYCWSTGGHAECADSAGADQLLKTGYLKPYTTAGGFDVTITFHSAREPKGFNVQLVQSPMANSRQ